MKKSDQVLEWCRGCKDKRDVMDHHDREATIQPAEFIVWGKLFPPEALGPRCYNCAAEQIGHNALQHRSGYAVFRLKGLVRG